MGGFEEAAKHRRGILSTGIGNSLWLVFSFVAPFSGVQNNRPGCSLGQWMEQKRGELELPHFEGFFMTANPVFQS